MNVVEQLELLKFLRNEIEDRNDHNALASDYRKALYTCLIVENRHGIDSPELDWYINLIRSTPEDFPQIKKALPSDQLFTFSFAPFRETDYKNRVIMLDELIKHYTILTILSGNPI